MEPDKEPGLPHPLGPSCSIKCDKCSLGRTPEALSSASHPSCLSCESQPRESQARADGWPCRIVPDSESKRGLCEPINQSSQALSSTMSRQEGWRVRNGQIGCGRGVWGSGQRKCLVLGRQAQLKKMDQRHGSSLEAECRTTGRHRPDSAVCMPTSHISASPHPAPLHPYTSHPCIPTSHAPRSLHPIPLYPHISHTIALPSSQSIVHCPVSPHHHPFIFMSTSHSLAFPYHLPLHPISLTSAPQAPYPCIQQPCILTSPIAASQYSYIPTLAPTSMYPHTCASPRPAALLPLIIP